MNHFIISPFFDRAADRRGPLVYAKTKPRSFNHYYATLAFVSIIGMMLSHSAALAKEKGL